ncbi:MAG: mechanosensitive ion channel family protein [Cyanobium sp.]
MTPLIVEPLGWLALLIRPDVLLQIALMVVVLLMLAPLLLRLPWLARLPRGMPRLGLLVLLGLLLAQAGQRWGLVLLVGQILATWVGLRLMEKQLLARWLPPDQMRVLVSRVFRPLFLVGVLLVLLDALGSLQALASQPLGVWLGTPVQLGRLFEVVFWLYLVVVGSELPALWLGWLVQRGLDLTDGGRRALSLVIRYVLVGLAILWALQRLGVNQTGVLAVAGGLSVGLGFGVKEVFSNFVSGLWLLFEGSVRPGEVLMHEGEACEVRRLGLRAATLWRGSDNAELVVPNQTFFTQTTTTYTRSDRQRRCRFEIQASAHWPPKEILELLASIATADPDVLRQPAPQARLLEFGPEMNRYNLSFTIRDPLKAGRVTADVLLAVWQAFASRGILSLPNLPQDKTASAGPPLQPSD